MTMKPILTIARELAALQTLEDGGSNSGMHIKSLRKGLTAQLLERLEAAETRRKEREKQERAVYRTGADIKTPTLDQCLQHLITTPNGARNEQYLKWAADAARYGTGAFKVGLDLGKPGGDESAFAISYVDMDAWFKRGAIERKLHAVNPMWGMSIIDQLKAAGMTSAPKKPVDATLQIMASKHTGYFDVVELTIDGRPRQWSRKDQESNRDLGDRVIRDMKEGEYPEAMIDDIRENLAVARESIAKIVGNAQAAKANGASPVGAGDESAGSDDGGLYDFAQKIASFPLADGRSVDAVPVRDTMKDEVAAGALPWKLVSECSDVPVHGLVDLTGKDGSKAMAVPASIVMWTAVHAWRPAHDTTLPHPGAGRSIRKDAYDGWNEWDGDIDRAPRRGRVDVKLRNGVIGLNDSPENFCWSHMGNQFDIVAWRPTEQ